MLQKMLKKLISGFTPLQVIDVEIYHDSVVSEKKETDDELKFFGGKERFYKYSFYKLNLKEYCMKQMVVKIK